MTRGHIGVTRIGPKKLRFLKLKKTFLKTSCKSHLKFFLFRFFCEIVFVVKCITYHDVLFNISIVMFEL